MNDESRSASRPLPRVSLKGVQGFCAIARLGTVAAAARALGVTPSALSHALRDLEGQLNARLFHRAGGRLRLTTDGQRLAEGTVPAMGRIEEALDGFRRRRSELRITTLSTFASRCLIPRLNEFQARHPDIELLVSTTTEALDLEREGFDCALRWGKGGWPGTVAERLYTEELVAVCAPALRDRLALRAPKDMSRVPLIRSKARPGSWRAWFDAAGLSGLDTTDGPMLETRNLAIQAAIGQMGMAVVDRHFVSEEIAAGQLVAPFPISVRMDEGLWFVRPANRGTTRPLSLFHAWLTETFGESEDAAG